MLELARYNAENPLMTFDADLKRVFDAAVAELTELSNTERQRAREEGLTQGRAEGWENGREQGRAEGRSEAEQQSRIAIDAAVAAVRAETAADAAAIDRLLDAVRAIDRAHSLAEVLDTLVGCAAREVARAGVLLVRDDRLVSWRFIGFDSLGARGLDIPLSEGGVIAEAVRTGSTASGETGGEAGAPRFAALEKGHESLAVPVTLGGAAVAVLYADEGAVAGHAPAHGRQTWPEALEILTRHAARSLEALTAAKAARAIADAPATANRVRLAASARSASPRSSATPSSRDDDDEGTAAQRYARLLVSEIKLYHEPEVVAGQRDRDLGTRLAGEIARARVMYEERVSASVRERADYFHDELVRTLANGDAAILQLT
jgi:hypothetical protein